MESVIMMIHSTLGSQTAWFILHIIVNNSALVEMIFVEWWIVLITGELWEWIWAIEVTILFLMFASDIMIADLESIKVLNTTSLSFLICDFLELTLFLSK